MMRRVGVFLRSERKRPAGFPCVTRTPARASLQRGVPAQENKRPPEQKSTLPAPWHPSESPSNRSEEETSALRRWQVISKHIPCQVHALAVQVQEEVMGRMPPKSDEFSRLGSLQKLQIRLKRETFRITRTLISLPVISFKFLQTTDLLGIWV